MRKAPFIIAATAIAVLGSLTLKAESLNQTGLDFLSAKLGGQAVSVESQKPRLAKSASGVQPQFEVVNATVNNTPCFAVVVGTESGVSVIGYGDNANITELPDALLDIINNAATSRLVAGSNDTFTPVAPMIKTKWGQNEPFNLKAPMVGGEHGVAGCVAVAMAQVLNYWRSDAPGYDSIEYVDNLRSGGSNAEIQVDYTKALYDWNLMLNDYSSGYSDAQAQEVARLMFECGAAAASTWRIVNHYSNGKLVGSTKSTTAYDPYVALNRYYNFNCNYLSRKFTATPIFMETVRNELYARRPVIYSGSSATNGHSFIVDGLDEQGFGHINWGWCGEADGYYDLNFCMPSNASTSAEAYDSGQNLVYNIRPRTTGEKYLPSFVTPGRICNSSDWDYGSIIIPITSNFYSAMLGAESNSPSFSCFGWVNTETGDLISDSYLQDKFNAENNGRFPSYSKNYFWPNSIPQLPDGIADGEYHYALYNCDASGAAKYAGAVLLDNTSRAVVKDGIATYTNRYDFQPTWTFSNVTIHEPTAKSTLFIECDYLEDSYNVDVQTPRVEFALTDVNTGAQYVSEVVEFPSEYPGVSRHYQFAVAFAKDNGIRIPAGTYRLSSSESYSTYNCENIIVEIAPQLDYPLMVASAAEWTAELTQRGAVAMWNGAGGYCKPQDSSLSVFNRWYSCNKVTTPIDVNFYAVSVETGKEHYLTTYKGYQPKEYNLVDWIYPEGNLYPLLGDYYLVARYMTPDGEKPCSEPWYNPYTPGALFSVSASTTTVFQNLVINSIDRSVSVDDPQLAVSVANNGTVDFAGVLYLTLRNLSDGRIIEATSDAVAIAQGKSAIATFTIADLNVDDQFVASIKSVAGTSRATSSPTAVLDEIGDPAAFMLTATDGTGINDVIADENVTEVVRYNLMGTRLSMPTPGINIIVYKNGTVRKVVVK